MIKMDKKRSRIISIGIGIAIIAFLFWYVKVDDIIVAFSNFSLINLLIYLLVSVTIMILLTIKWSIVLNSFGIKIPFIQLFKYKLAGFGVSYITPSAHIGGEPVRAHLLHKNHNIEFKKSLSCVVIDKSLELILNGLFGCIGILIVLFNFTLPKRTTAIMILSFFALISIIYSFYRLTLQEKGFFTTALRFLRIDKIKILKKYENEINEFESHIISFFKYNWKAFFKASFVFLIAWLFMFIEYKIALRLVGYDASLSAVFIVISLVALAYIIPIPAALGSLEFGQSSAAALLGFSSAIGLALSLFIRGRDLLWTFIGLSYLGLHKIKFMDALLNNHNGKK
ncbi:MAG: lysylphosphatidylglycerol synthase transmembrane domain-containing protein [Candidatus Nanoarchaeia archaeon]|nr:lysylphosphatidylglycerol synthase transmembrane domain-containing protein [Candidatus Nanoarchaeia archaeon]